MKSHRCSCPCCGHLTYEPPIAGSMQICPICFWEDAPGEEYWNGSNSVSLVSAQQNFEEFGASEREFADAVRRPLPGEERPSDWLSLDQLAQAIIALIESAFANATLGDGITIHQREAIDGYQSAEEIEDARRLDKERCWQEITEEKIGRCGTTLTFLDPKSIRYHLPAFMRHALRVWSEVRYFGPADSILYSLASGPRSKGYHEESFLLLDRPQNEAVAAFLKFVSLVDPIYGNDAEKGLKNGWAAWVPDSLPFSNYSQIQS
jgi:hypothetical protein